MLKFSQEQVQAFDHVARQREARRLCPIMRRNFARQTEKLDDAALEKTIADALDRAAHWGVDKQTACVNFVILTIVLGADFYKMEKIRKFFNSPMRGVTPATKVNLLTSEFKYLLRQRPAVDAGGR